MHVHRTGDTAAETSRRRQRAASVALHDQRLVVRVQLSRVGRERDLRVMGRNAGRASVLVGPVFAHTEHVLGHRHRAPGDAPVLGVRAGDRVLRGPARHAAGHRATPEPRGRRAPGVHRPAGGEVHAGAGHVPCGSVRRRRLLVEHAQSGHLDVQRVLRVHVHRPGHHAHVRADRLEHRAPVRGHQRGDRVQAHGLSGGRGGGVRPQPPWPRLSTPATGVDVRRPHRGRHVQQSGGHGRPPIRYKYKIITKKQYL